MNLLSPRDFPSGLSALALPLSLCVFVGDASTGCSHGFKRILPLLSLLYIPLILAPRDFCLLLLLAIR